MTTVVGAVKAYSGSAPDSPVNDKVSRLPRVNLPAANDRRPLPEVAGEKLKNLSKRERQVLKLLVQGLDNAAIAEALNVTPKTAAFHVANILGKLEVASRQAAIAWAHTYLPEDLIKLLG